MELNLVQPSWMEGIENVAEDQCAHGGIRFEVDGEKFLDESESFTVSAAALFLLRSVFTNHTENSPVSEGNVLFPCCGFSVFESTSSYPVIVIGCPSGKDMQITHSDGFVLVKSQNLEKSIPRNDWAKAVVGFADQVLSFYSASAKKASPIDPEDQKGWRLFWQEFHELKDRAEKDT